jgi:hypothetical protein
MGSCISVDVMVLPSAMAEVHQTSDLRIYETQLHYLMIQVGYMKYQCHKSKIHPANYSSENLFKKIIHGKTRSESRTS